MEPWAVIKKAIH